MTKNEYRRSLILLRSSESGYSGHVRLERRVTAGSMLFVLQTPQAEGSLRAALVGRDKRGVYACAIGDIRRDGRGQGTLTYAFDPRNICGRELDMYRLIAVVRTSGSGCAPVLLGNLNGYADMDLNSVSAALCDLYGARDGAGDAAQPIPPEPPAQIAAPQAEPVGPDAEPSIPDAEPPAQAAEPEPFVSEPSASEPFVSDPFVSEPSVSEPSVSELSAPEPSAPEPSAPEMSAPEPSAPEMSALELIGLAPDAQWPALIERALPYFQDQSPAEDVPDGEHVYVRVPVDGEDAHLLIGVRAEAGSITGIAFALPADYAADPPDGLSDFSWQGDDRTGWWVLRIDAPGDE